MHEGIRMIIGKKLLLASTIFVLSNASALPQAMRDQNPDTLYAEVYSQLGIKLPGDVARDSSVWLRLDELRREPCDQVSIIGLSDALKPLGYRREAADSLMSFYRRCEGPKDAPSRAAAFYMQLSDYRKAVSASDAWVTAEPESSTARYNRGRAYSKAHEPLKALDDYASTVELFSVKKDLSSNVFTEMAEAYSVLGQPCEAMGAIQTWVSFKPDVRDTTQSRRLISDYAAQGNCETPKEGQPEHFRATPGSKVVTAIVEINGAKGRFIIDTGASFVSIKESLAQRARVKTNTASRVTLNTANGAGTGTLSNADDIKLGSLSAKGVQLVIQKDSPHLYGDDIDGLLGMSFLSRFQVTLLGNVIEVKPKGFGRPL